jgi:hypothetical protein
MSNEIEDLFGGGGAPAFKFDAVGDAFAGTITAVAVQQERDYATGDPVCWPDGRPKNQAVLTVEDANGVEWRLFIKGHLFTAMKAALAEASAAGPAVGGKIAVQHHALGEIKQKGFNAPKLFKVKYEAPAPGAADLDALFG